MGGEGNRKEGSAATYKIVSIKQHMLRKYGCLAIVINIQCAFTVVCYLMVVDLSLPRGIPSFKYYLAHAEVVKSCELFSVCDFVCMCIVGI